MTTLWRLHIRPGGGKGDVKASVAFCMKQKIIGMGWPVTSEIKRSTDLEWYNRAAAEEYREDLSWHSASRFADVPALHDLVWFRDTDQRYYVAEISGPWQYAYDNNEAIDADIVNTRPARIIDVGLADAVPGKIIACFRPPRTFQEIQSPGMLAFTQQLAGVPVEGDTSFDLYEFMSDADLENLVGIYLQSIGWYILPGTRTPTTAHYEFVLVSRETGERAIVQVKSGNVVLSAAAYAGTEKTFLFTASENYGPSLPSNVVLITRKDLDDFIQAQRQLLPKAVVTWIELIGRGKA